MKIKLLLLPLIAMPVVALLLSSPVHGEEFVEIGWEDLEAKGLEFDDPFEELSEEQLYRLSLVAEFREVEPKVSEEDKKSQAFKRIEQDYNDAISLLEEDGIDIEGLLAQRGVITEKRRIIAMTPNEEMDGKRVRIPGYMLPLEYTCLLYTSDAADDDRIV